MRANYFSCFLIGAWLMVVQAANAQQASDFQQQLLGSWEGTGSLFGNTATFSMEWESTLNDKFLSLKFQNNFTDASGTERQMQARAFYNLATRTGYWFDSRGQALPLIFEIRETTMTVFWGEEATEKGKTIYTLHPSGAKVEDYVYRGTDYVSFGNAEYLKTK